MADEETLESGLWLTDDGKLVKKQPEGGATQLVRPGGRLTEAVQARIDSLNAPDSEPATVTTDSLTPKPAKRAAKTTKKR